ncbi:MAG: hypothetical protein ACI8RD_003703 [Bacillariaceae sp.]|jgi:hypothetical protein
MRITSLRYCHAVVSVGVCNGGWSTVLLKYPEEVTATYTSKRFEKNNIAHLISSDRKSIFSSPFLVKSSSNYLDADHFTPCHNRLDGQLSSPKSN